VFFFLLIFFFFFFFHSLASNPPDLQNLFSFTPLFKLDVTKAPPPPPQTFSCVTILPGSPERCCFCPARNPWGSDNLSRPPYESSVLTFFSWLFYFFLAPLHPMFSFFFLRESHRRYLSFFLFFFYLTQEVPCVPFLAVTRFFFTL